MKVFYNLIGFLFSFFGFIAGVVAGFLFGNIFVAVFVWIIVALVVMLYFGIAALKKEQEELQRKIFDIEHLKLGTFARKASFNEWKCPKCGNINANYVGSCGCGENRPE